MPLIERQFRPPVVIRTIQRAAEGRTLSADPLRVFNFFPVASSQRATTVVVCDLRAFSGSSTICANRVVGIVLLSPKLGRDARSIILAVEAG